VASGTPAIPYLYRNPEQGATQRRYLLWRPQRSAVVTKPAKFTEQRLKTQGTTLLRTLWDKVCILNRQIKLERNDGKVRVLFDNPAAAAREAQARTAAEESLHRMRTELTNLLDQHKASRRSLPHLAGLERALKARGAAALGKMPERVLKRALHQLEGLMTARGGTGLADLRARLVVAVTAVERIEAAAARNAGPTSFLADHKLQVSEASVTDFMRVAGDRGDGA